MIQPFFPEPIQVIKSVSQSSYDVRLTFVKRTMVAFAGTLLLTAIAAKLITPFLGPVPASLTLLAVLVALTLSRRFLIRGNTESIVSATGLVVTLALIADLLSFAQSEGWPIFLFTAQLLMMLVYTLACGRDFSFMGFIVIGALTQIAVTLLATFFGLVPTHVLGFAIIAAIVFSSYVGYNLAMIMKRRRPDEIVSSVTDMYRDLLNWSTYPIRVIDHWRKYRFNITH